MSSDQRRIDEYIRYACQTSPAEWGVVLVEGGSRWKIETFHGLRKDQVRSLEDHLAETKTLKWLEKAIKQASSYRTVKGELTNLGVERIYAISPNLSEQKKGSRMLLIGGKPLKHSDLRFLGSILSEPNSDDGPFNGIPFPPGPKFSASGVSLGLEENLRTVLATLLSTMDCELGAVAVRAGDEYTIHAIHGLPKDLLEKVILVEGSSDLARMLASQQAFIYEQNNAVGGEIKSMSLPEAAWLVMPVAIGQRVIGMVLLGREQPFSPDELESATLIGGHIAPSIEKSILGVEAAYYLQRFAVLNDLASFASSGMELHQVIVRGEAMLGRAFGASRTRILMYDQVTREFFSYSESGTGIDRQGEKAMTLEKSVMDIGQVLRIGNLSETASHISSRPEIESLMVVPMRFRGRVIGVLTLECERIDAFSEQDEKFVLVVASQMASIIISLQLNREMRQRAKAMQAVNEIAQEIVGLDDVSLIAERTAQLMADKFEFGMVLVMLLDEQLDELIAEGVAGVNASDVPIGFRFSKNLGIPGQVMAFGNSVLLPDVEKASNYVPIPGWEPGSGAWVPLSAGGDRFGVVSVEFQQKGRVDKNDLAVIEAIAGILSTVLTNARQYEQLQQSVLQLEAVRETALDIGANLDLQTLLKRVVNRVRTLLDAHGAELGFVDHENNMVEVLVSENPWQDYRGYRFKFNAGVTGKVAATAEALAIADFNSWSGRADREFKAPFTTVAGVPLMLMGVVIGTLVVQDDRPARAFTNNDLRILELLAPQLAVFIHNARLYQELEMRMEAQRLAEERLVRSARLAAVGEMAAAVAHELNNPLTTVTGFAELILESMPEDSPEHEDMSLVLSEAQRSRSVVRRLLDFSRQSDLLRVDTDLNELITVVLQMIHHIAQTENIIVRMELWGDIPLIRVDRNQIQQVILNLVHNAIQAMPDGGELIVQSLMEKRDGETWLGIRVEDNGVGIDEEVLDQIFEPFFTTKPSGEGTGLGLSVSYSIISEHGGYIDVSSSKGKGSVFVIWLPSVREDEKG